MERRKITAPIGATAVVGKRMGRESIIYEDRRYVTIVNEMSVKDLIDRLSSVVARLGDGFEHVHLKHAPEECYCNYDGCDCDQRFVFMGNRLENDIELNFRKEKEEKEKSYREASEYKTYQRLKAKFEGGA